mmetsp:Transcript_27855/g.90027  ORF Transcript_27855/g.90027 Transcript_27855/m.90027 type:complete len:263 (+) Transcript_27855:1433-2221(+)
MRRPRGPAGQGWWCADRAWRDRGGSPPPLPVCPARGRREDRRPSGWSGGSLPRRPARGHRKHQRSLGQRHGGRLRDRTRWPSDPKAAIGRRHRGQPRRPASARRPHPVRAGGGAAVVARAWRVAVPRGAAAWIGWQGGPRQDGGVGARPGAGGRVGQRLRRALLCARPAGGRRRRGVRSIYGLGGVHRLLHREDARAPHHRGVGGGDGQRDSGPAASTRGGDGVRQRHDPFSGRRRPQGRTVHRVRSLTLSRGSRGAAVGQE